VFEEYTERVRDCWTIGRERERYDRRNKNNGQGEFASDQPLLSLISSGHTRELTIHDISILIQSTIPIRIGIPSGILVPKVGILRCPGL
jgi:hypothetical protein